MWWPRPRWKHNNSDPFADFLALVVSLQITATAMTATADEGGQHCASNNDAVSSDFAMWTTVLCTTLFVLAAIAIFYYIYCKKRTHHLSSLWWKNDSGKNIVLQTSAPVKEKSQKNGGTDNPAFLADNNYVVGSKIVRIPLSSTVIDASGSIGIELSEVDGKQIYTCKQKDGLMDHLIAMRLVFDNKQQHANPSSDLNQALVELSRKYGLSIELETKREPAGVMDNRAAGNRDETVPKCARSNNLLSAVCGKAQCLWRQQKQFVFKDGENNGGDGVLAAVDNDVEAAVVPSAVHCSSTMTSAAVATVIDETSRKRDGSLRRYNTLEYGASPVSAELVTPPIEESSPGEQCCINSSSSTICIINTSEEPIAAISVAAVDGDKNAAKFTTTVGSDGIAGKRDEPKNAPPPPPPRKYSAPKVDDAGPPASTKTTDKAPQTPVRDEIRVDDYYWCTTTVMAPPLSSSMSTFGKKRSFAADGDGVGNDVSDKTMDVGETVVSSALDGGKSTTTDVVDGGKSTTTDVVDGDKSTTTDIVDSDKSTTTDVVDGDSTIVDGGGTTSIEDASLPSFPSDDDDDEEEEEEEIKEKQKHKYDDELAISPLQHNGTATTVVPAVAAAATETKSPTKLPTLRLSLSTPPSGTAAVTSCSPSSVTSTSTSSSPTNNSGHNSGLPTISKIPVRRQSAGTGFTVAAFTTNTTNCTAKKSLMFNPLSKSTSRLAM